MNDRRLLLPAIALAAFLALLPGCGGPPADPPPLAGARMGGPFRLTDQHGRPFSSDSLRGKYRIVYFGYTYCPDVCPVDLQLISAALSQFEQRHASRAMRVQPIFISVDPERDTPRVVALTGTPDEIARVERAYAVYASRREPERPGGPYLVDHTRVTALYGPNGEPIMLLPTDQGPGGIVAALERWVR
jgi:protein SCO1